MDTEKMLLLAATLRKFAVQMQQYAEQLENRAHIERAKAQPDIGGLITKLIEYRSTKCE